MILLAAAALSPVAYGQLVPTHGLTHFQVLQRDATGNSSVAFKGTSSYGGQGTLEAALFKAGQVGEIRPFAACGSVAGGTFEARLEGLATGGPYEIRLRVKDDGGRSVDRGSVREVMVGDLWILAGQSNMEGCGILRRGAVPPHRLVHVFDPADRWLLAEEPLHWKHEAVDEAISGPPGPQRDKLIKEARKHRWRGGGLGLPFAREVVERTGVPIGLLPCALGATSLDQWSPALKERGGRSLYGAMLRRFHAVGGRVRGVLWYQGEADAMEGKPGTYAQRFQDFVAAVRKDFEQPKLPFYYVQLGRYQFPEKENQWTALRAAQLECEAKIPPPVGMVAAIDLPLVDAIHLRTSAQKVLGKRLAFLACRDLLGWKDRYRGPRPAGIVSSGGYPQRVIITFSDVNGRLRTGRRLHGFSIRDKDGLDLRIIFDQFLDPDAPNRVILECQVTWGYKPLPEDAFVHYGYGNDPFCNLEDEAGLAAPGFGPIPLPVQDEK